MVVPALGVAQPLTWLFLLVELGAGQVLGILDANDLPPDVYAGTLAMSASYPAATRKHTM